MPHSVTVGDIVGMLERRYPPALAADWDAVGLAVGDPGVTVSRVLFAVDPVIEVVDEALLLQADLVVTHHPLMLRGVHSVAAVDHRGSVVHTLVSHGIALYSAHTNADHADPGVSDALATALGLTGLRPLVAEPGESAVGTGRVGELPVPTTLAAFAESVATALPATVQGVRVGGDPDATVRTVAVCGGSGGDFLEAAAAVADAYVTADLRHHRALDHLVDGGCGLVDVSHWASEWLWLPVAAEALAHDVAAVGSTVDVHVSTIRTDPWTLHVGSPR